MSPVPISDKTSNCYISQSLLSSLGAANSYLELCDRSEILQAPDSSAVDVSVKFQSDAMI